jgi:hypothetical protein
MPSAGRSYVASAGFELLFQRTDEDSHHGGIEMQKHDTAATLHALRRAVHRALSFRARERRAAWLLAGLTAATGVTAGPFPAELELSRLLPANGGDGSEGFVMVGVFNPDQRDTNGDGFGNICDADLDDDCLVAGNDWLIMRDVLGTNDPHADLNGDGIVARQDVLILFNARFQPPGPSGLPNACEGQ